MALKMHGIYHQFLGGSIHKKFGVSCCFLGEIVVATIRSPLYWQIRTILIQFHPESRV